MPSCAALAVLVTKEVTITMVETGSAVLLLSDACQVSSEDAATFVQVVLLINY